MQLVLLPCSAVKLALQRLPDLFAVCRLAPTDEVPDWASGRFVSITCTAEELSIVCPQRDVPADVRAERGWRALRVAGTLDFSLVGVLARLTATLAEVGISLFVISTYDTDYLLVKESDLAAAEAALEAGGCPISVSQD